MSAQALPFVPRENFAVGTTVAASDTVPMPSARGGRVLVPLGSSITTLTVYETDGRDGADSDTWYNTQVTITVSGAADNSYEIPDSLFACRLLRFVGDAEGTIRLVMKG